MSRYRGDPHKSLHREGPAPKLREGSRAQQKAHEQRCIAGFIPLLWAVEQFLKDHDAGKSPEIERLRTAVRDAGGMHERRASD